MKARRMGNMVGSDCGGQIEIRNSKSEARNKLKSKNSNDRNGHVLFGVFWFRASCFGLVEGKVGGVGTAAFGDFDFEGGLEVVFFGDALDGEGAFVAGGAFDLFDFAAIG